MNKKPETIEEAIDQAFVIGPVHLMKANLCYGIREFLNDRLSTFLSKHPEDKDMVLEMVEHILHFKMSKPAKTIEEWKKS